MPVSFLAWARLPSGMLTPAPLPTLPGAPPGAAQDTVTGIVADAAEWAAAELAATAVADVLTPGLATIGGALAESATLAGFAARAERITAEFAVLVEQLATELVTLKAARDALGSARGLGAVRALRALRQAEKTVSELRGAGSVVRALDGVADAALGQATGLPLGLDGARSLGSQVRRTLADEADGTEESEDTEAAEDGEDRSKTRKRWNARKATPE